MAYDRCETNANFFWWVCTSISRGWSRLSICESRMSSRHTLKRQVKSTQNTANRFCHWNLLVALLQQVYRESSEPFLLALRLELKIMIAFDIWTSRMSPKHTLKKDIGNTAQKRIANTAQKGKQNQAQKIRTRFRPRHLVALLQQIDRVREQCKLLLLALHFGLDVAKLGVEVGNLGPQWFDGPKFTIQ